MSSEAALRAPQFPKSGPPRGHRTVFFEAAWRLLTQIRAVLARGEDPSSFAPFSLSRSPLTEGCAQYTTQIQALRRPVPDLGMLSGLDRRREWEYKRDGTVNLLVTYTPITGSLWGRVLPKNNHDYFIEGMEAYVATLPRTIRYLHCILDNGSSHIAKETQAWVAAQAGRVEFHFTPAHASWVNQAELALSAFSRQYLRDRVSQSWAELIAHIYRALDEYKRFHARPFNWSFTRHAVHEWYARRTSAMLH